MLGDVCPVNSIKQPNGNDEIVSKHWRTFGRGLVNVAAYVCKRLEAKHENRAFQTYGCAGVLSRSRLMAETQVVAAHGPGVELLLPRRQVRSKAADQPG